MICLLHTVCIPSAFGLATLGLWAYIRTMQILNIYVTSHVDGAITSQYHELTVPKGVPFTLTCSSRCSRSDFCHVAWTTNKTIFVKNDKEHTTWSTLPHKGTQNHYLTLHSARSSTNYQCLLIAVSGRIIDSSEQSVYVKDTGEWLAKYAIVFVYKNLYYVLSR